MNNGIPQISVTDFKRKRDAGEDIYLLDVREPHEFQIANLGGHLIPLGDLPARINELDSNREIVVHCKMGGRSQKAAELLKQAGFNKIQNLAGGIRPGRSRSIPAFPNTKSETSTSLDSNFINGTPHGVPFYFAPSSGLPVYSDCLPVSRNRYESKIAGGVRSHSSWT